MEKVYTSAVGVTHRTLYLEAFGFILAVFGILYFIYIFVLLFLRGYSLAMTLLGVISGIIILSVIVIFFPYWRKTWFREIVLDDTGIIAHGLFKKIIARWDEVLQVEPKGERFIEVKTKNGNFLFNMYMKEKDSQYPKIGWMDNVWIDAHGNHKPCTPENCPLYIEIQKHVSRV